MPTDVRGLPLFSLLAASACGGSSVEPLTVEVPTTPPSATANSTESASRPGTGNVEGAVSFTGRAPAKQFATRASDAEFCKDHLVPHNAVVVTAGKLADVFVRIVGPVRGSWPAPADP